MKKRVVFKFTVFDESIKEIAKEVAREFPGVTKVVEVEGEGQLEVRGEFSTSELKKELMKIDESVETFKIRPDGVTEPEVKLQQQDEGKRPINIEEVFGKPSNDDASSSTWTGLGYGLWEQAKGVAVGAAEKAKDIGVGAAEKAKDIGVGAVGLIEKEMKAKPEPKKGGGGDPRKRFGGEELYPREKRGIIDGVKNYFERKKWQEEDRLRNEWMKKEDMNQKKMMQEHMRKHGLLAKKSEGGTTQGSTATGNTGSLWNTIRTGVASGYTHTLRTGEASGSTHTQRTGEASGSTQENRREEKRKKESAAKKGKNGN